MRPMSERKKLTDAELAAAMADLPGWTIVGGKLHKEFGFADFNEAFGFMTRVALIAERMNHHPDWSNVYNRVVINLVTHDLGGISDLDLEFARKLEATQT
jgi:4a-hydroxytetrahydrobiopterin dehydratase